MFQKIKQIYNSICTNIKQNSIIVAGITTISVIGLISYTIRVREHKRLYKIYNECQLQQKQIQQLFHKQSLTNYQPIKILTKQHNILNGWHFKATIKLRNPNKLILYFHSQHTKLTDNLSHIKNIIEYTVCDVLIIEYRYHKKQQNKKRNQQILKQDAYQIFNKALQIINKQNKQLVIFGRDIGAILGIYLCTLEQYRYRYQLKGLILQNIYGSILDKKIQQIFPYSISTSSISINKNNNYLVKIIKMIYWLILQDKWQIKYIMKKLRVPTMLIVDQILSNQSSILLYSLYQGRKFVYQFKKKQELKLKQQLKQKQKQGKLDNNKWKKDITNYFMEMNIFLNTLV